MEERRIALYPGCTLEGSSSAFEASLEKVLETMSVESGILKDWNCCGATSAHAIDHNLYLSLCLRNLALAENQQFDEVLAPCAACYHRLASANLDFRNDNLLLDRLNAETNLAYKGTVKVRNILDFFANVINRERISSAVKKPLSDLKIACYYGCLNTRIPRMEPFDDREYPMTMDNIVEALGAEPIDWSYKTECCGASLFVTAEPVSAKLAAGIMKDAIAREADCIAVACPMCQSNLDIKQDAIRKQFNISRPVPILYITQLMGIAFGVPDPDLQLNQNFVPFTRQKTE
ncbi:CoB--CoM heterodisulfide reductase iron-sulfur subunit B family protein [Verrucomicrobiota bacterium]